VPRLITFLLTLIFLVSLFSEPALAEKRIALVIGNDHYPNLPADRQLQKAGNDADAVGDALALLGFKVIRGHDLGRQAMFDKLSEFTNSLSPGDTAGFFFAGHGVALGGSNFILPSDVPVVTEGGELRLRGAAITETEIIEGIQASGVRVAMLVLDACRDNPFPHSRGRTVGQTRGLTDAKPSRGVFTIYSAGIGQTALDALEPNDPNRNSVFTRVFIEQLAKPGVDLGGLAIEVRERVAELALKAKNDFGQPDPHEQTPAYYDQTLGGRIYLAGLPKPEELMDLNKRSSEPVRPIDDRAVPNIGALAVQSEFVNSVNALALSFDGAFLASANDKTGLVSIWNTATGQLLKVIGRPQSIDNSIWSIAFSNDGRYIATGSNDQSLNFYELATGKLINRIDKIGYTPELIRFSRDDLLMVSLGPEDQSIVDIWDVPSGAHHKPMHGEQRDGIPAFGAVTSAAFSPDDKNLVVGYGDKSARVWNLATNRISLSLIKHRGWVRGVDYSEDGKAIITASDDELVRIWNLEDGSLRRSLGVAYKTPMQDGNVTQTAFSADARYLLHLLGNGSFNVWNLMTGDQKHFNSQLLPGAVAETERLADIPKLGQAHLVRRIVEQWAGPNRHGRYAISTKRGIFVSGDYLGGIRIFDLSSGALILTMYDLGDGDFVTVLRDTNYLSSHGAGRKMAIAEGSNASLIDDAFERRWRTDDLSAELRNVLK
jgi:WD40 repeat protein